MNPFAIRTIQFHCSFRATQRGVSLVELMVALVAGLVLVGGVGQIYLSSKQTYRVQEAQSRLQENSRYSLEVLGQDLRRAGYQGCASRGSVIPNNTLGPSPIITFTNATVMAGSEAAGTGWEPAISESLVGKVVAGTDTVTIQFASGCNGHLVNNMGTSGADIQILAGNTCGLEEGRIFMISDCVNADIAQASTGAAAGTVTHAASLSKSYRSDAEVLRVYSYTYYIGNGQDGQPALFRRDNILPLAEELVEGVENMQVTYGEDTDSDGTPNRYLAANAVTNWANVRSVRIQLLFRTLVDNLTSTAQVFAFDGTTITAGDKRLRRTFTATISVRNRLQ